MIYKDGFNHTFFIDEECIETISKKLVLLVDKYKFSIDTISILSHIELKKITGFLNKKEGLTYDEINMLDNVVLSVFESAIQTSIYNYECHKKVKDAREKGEPIIFKED
ncbi:hypothetical protein GNF68_14210 [Clostridium perfringens]|uniref:Uncharacterized protein n=1 Tax=Clostridium perfringens TaxID=1502 RepID=A0AAW9I7H6_CLOPF|nr:hypothetical protein [Clostridium perfringens]MDZ4910186.1 hypothetical protein [Clostridium perfringens]